MKRKTKETILIGMIMLMIIGLTTTVNAASTFKASVTANKTTLKPGEEVTVTVAVSDIDMGTNGINTLEGKIKYDTNIFEEVKSSSIQSLNNWATTYNDESSTLNGKFLAVNLSSGAKKSTQIFSVKFKVKLDISETIETQIVFEDITSNDGTDLISIGTKSVKLTINVENLNTDENTTVNVSNVAGNVTTDNTQSGGMLPNTGKSVAIVVSIIVLIFVGIVLGIKNKSMDDVK